jgi:hypothetical protein
LFISILNELHIYFKIRRPERDEAEKFYIRFIASTNPSVSNLTENSAIIELHPRLLELVKKWGNPEPYVKQATSLAEQMIGKTKFSSSFTVSVSNIFQ